MSKANSYKNRQLSPLEDRDKNLQFMSEHSLRENPFQSLLDKISESKSRANLEIDRHLSFSQNMAGNERSKKTETL